MVKLLNIVETISLELGRKVNHAKTKLTVVDCSDNLELTGALNLKTVEVYLLRREHKQHRIVRKGDS